MTKLEKKLIELGYKLKIEEDCVIASKNINFIYEIVIGICDNTIQSYYVYSYSNYIRWKDTINHLQKAFDTMQKDLEILKGMLEDEDEKS